MHQEWGRAIHHINKVKLKIKNPSLIPNSTNYKLETFVANESGQEHYWFPKMIKENGKDNLHKALCLQNWLLQFINIFISIGSVQTLNANPSKMVKYQNSRTKRINLKKNFSRKGSKGNISIPFTGNPLAGRSYSLINSKVSIKFWINNWNNCYFL